MDVDAGHGAALGGALPTQPGELPLARRLRSLLSWPTTDSDPVTQLVRTHRGIHAGTDPAVLRRAYTIAENMHRGQFRKSGEPYITHPLAVAQICAELGMDTTTLVAALLHDTVEDTRYTLQALAEDFGGEVAHLVDGVTKFDKAFYGKAAEAETIRKMIVAAAKDVRVLVIKLADRLHNMRTLGVRSASSRERIARDPGGAGPALRPARHPDPQARAGGRGAAAPGARRVRAARPARARPAGVGRVPRRGGHPGQGGARAQPGRRRGEPASPAPLLDLEGHRRRRAHRPVRPAPHRGGGRRPGHRLLRRAGRDPRHVAADPRPFQGLHRLPEEQPLPLAAHQRLRARRTALWRC